MAQAPPAIDTDIPVCGSPPAAVVVKQYLRESCRLILETLGERAVAAIVVSGSAALGELTALACEEGGPLVLSDVDLSVVTRTEAQRDRGKAARPALLDKMAALPEARSMCSPPEIGLYSLRDLEIQSPKMGVLEMRTSGKVVWGDDRVLGMLPRFGATEISRDEAIALLFNRCFELLRAGDWEASKEPRDAIKMIYACAKSVLDSGTALAAYYGRYVPGYRKRLRQIARSLNEHCAGGLGVVKAEAFLDGVSFWTDFKIEPDLAAVARRFGVGGVGGWGAAACDVEKLHKTGREAWTEARLALIGMWTTLEAAEGAGAAGDAGATCSTLIGVERARYRLRGWRRLVLGGEVPPLRAIRLARRGSPIHLLRLSAFRALDQLGKGRDSTGAARRDRTLDEDASRFLKRYFPVSVKGMGEAAGADAWRRRIVDVRRRWTERYWS